MATRTTKKTTAKKTSEAKPKTSRPKKLAHGVNLAATEDVALDKINADLKRNARFVYDEEALKELGESIKRRGQLQACVGRFNKDGTVELLIGFRRYFAAKLAGIQTLKVAPYTGVLKDQEIDNAAENVARVDLTLPEQVAAFKQLRDIRKLKQAEIAKHVGKSRSHVANLLSIGDGLIPEIMDAWRKMPDDFSFEWCRQVARKEAGEQKEAFEAFKKGKLVPDKSGKGKGTGKDAGGDDKETKPKRATAQDLQTLLGYLEAGRYNTESPDWRRGAEAALKFAMTGDRSGFPVMTDAPEEKSNAKGE